jgi:hypothetical protein
MKYIFNTQSSQIMIGVGAARNIFTEQKNLALKNLLSVIQIFWHLSTLSPYKDESHVKPVLRNELLSKRNINQGGNFWSSDY